MTIPPEATPTPTFAPTDPPSEVLVVGATGSIGALVVEQALHRGLRTRALVRDLGRASSLPQDAQRVVADLTDARSLARAVDGVDAVVFTHGVHGGAEAAEAVDYGAVRNVLEALRDRPARVALMSAIGVTRHTAGHDWKRRGERLVRASGRPYTVVRPEWFDYNDDDQHALVLLQGDRRWAGDPSDGVVSRRQIAEVLLAALFSPAAAGTTFELVAERGAPTARLEALFSGLRRDVEGAVDGVLDIANMPAKEEPEHVRADMEQLFGRRL